MLCVKNSLSELFGTKWADVTMNGVLEVIQVLFKRMMKLCYRLKYAYCEEMSLKSICSALNKAH